MVYRNWFILASVGTLALIAFLTYLWSAMWIWFLFVSPLILLGIRDMTQTRRTILRNFPVLGHLRFLFEFVRPEMQQYFIESNIDAHPIEREFRALVYARSKGQLETKPFGTERNVYAVGYEWASHSNCPIEPMADEPRIRIGGSDCKHPYEASHLNISAMSFGALSGNAVRALNRGAAKGGFAHNTGEGGISEHHLQGGDLIWQVGTGYFGCRHANGRFDPNRFADESARPEVKLIELKLSQGAKPGHGGVLPGEKVTKEIALIRGVEVGKTVISPPGHAEFDTPRGLLEFIARLRELSGGKPVGFKLCMGRRREFFAICKAMLDTGIKPDFISVDGGEGGTGAAPLEFSNSLGMPARDAWLFAHDALVGCDLRREIRLICSGKILTGFDIVRALALGADVCYSARGFMLSLGCIQALRCNTDECPTGVATQNQARAWGLNVTDKSERVFRFHHATVDGFLELVGAMGLHVPADVKPRHIHRRVDDLRTRSYAELYQYMEPGQLLHGEPPERLKVQWEEASAEDWYKPQQPS